MKIISTPAIPLPKGHYSQVIEHNGLLYVSGQLPVDPLTGKVPEGINKQTSLVLEKIDDLLNESGSSREQVIQMRIYISDITFWDDVNRIYAGFFADHRPARCIVPVKELHYGCLIEVEATAAVL
ncbi:MAG: RidA family protein [Bacteroidetes bacterium]|nr:RidA family protein [Bacteroidota bacterium]